MNEAELYRAAKCSGTELAVLRLIRDTFAKKDIDRDFYKNAGWNDIYKECTAQAVAAVVIDKAAVIEDMIAPEVFEEWVDYASGVMYYGENILYNQEKLTELFEKNGIALAVLKGAAAAYNYPEPLNRNMGDIDFLVEREDFDMAYELLLENGYTLAYPLDNTDYHITLKKDDMMYELHSEPAGIAHGAAGDTVRAMFRGACRRAVKTEINGYSFYMLPRLQNGLVLLLHIVKHIDEGLGLRQICDWGAFVDRELDDEVWESEFYPALEKAGLVTIAVTVTQLCRLYLGMAQDISWCAGADEKMCAELMRFVLDYGNFGSKSRSNVLAGAVLGKTMDSMSGILPVRVIKSLQKEGMREWKAARRFPLLRPIAWIYSPLRFIKRLMTGERSISQAAAIKKSIAQKKRLQDRLRVFK